ncbi:MAG: hypothetical protein JO199_14915, partial [Candidatus Eremiobacteraeota bacterium]|nr:hypothetical protein [Candidatus Eremiobacteraeota bacterium]
MRNFGAALAFALLILAAACGGHQESSTVASEAPPATPSAAPSESASPAGPASPEASGSPGTPTPQPTPTPDTNLLSWKNGAIVRSYPASPDDIDASDVAEHGMPYPNATAGPFTFVYELPGPAS